jgi:MFS family permease
LILAANNLANVFGQIGFGHLTDRFSNIYVLLFATTMMSAISAFTIWGFARSLETLLVFSLMYGWFGGAYIVFWPKFGTMLSDDPQTVYSLMAFGKGVGNLVTGPIATSLLTRPLSSGYGLGKFEPLIVFLGSMMVCSSLGIFGWPLRGKA